MVWLSVRHQHPYHGPTAAVIPVLPAFGVINAIATIAVARRATAGVTGRSELLRWEIVVLAVAWIAPYVAIAPAAVAGAGDSISYGFLPVSVPLLTVGLVWAAMMAARTRWGACGTGLAVAVVGALTLVTGPAGAWLTMGIGLCVVLLALAVTIVRQQHHIVAGS